ncbi:MAG: hypothetical protein V3U54_07650 [Thermodesulfobacteriota bacterium]
MRTAKECYMWYADFQETRIKMDLLLLRLQMAAGTKADFMKVTEELAKTVEKIYRDVYDKVEDKWLKQYGVGRRKKETKLEVL